MEEVKVVEKSVWLAVFTRRKRRGFPWLLAMFIIVVAVVLYRYYDLVEPLYNQLLAKLSWRVCFGAIIGITSVGWSVERSLG